MNLILGLINKSLQSAETTNKSVNILLKQKEDDFRSDHIYWALRDNVNDKGRLLVRLLKYLRYALYRRLCVCVCV